MSPVALTSQLSLESCIVHVCHRPLAFIAQTVKSQRVIIARELDFLFFFLITRSIQRHTSEQMTVIPRSIHSFEAWWMTYLGKAGSVGYEFLVLNLL